MKRQRCALLSVTDKTGIADFAHGLLKQEFQLLSTGGTAKALRDAGYPVTDVATYTGSPEMFDGRLKTLNTKVFGAILARPGVDDALLEKLGWPPIDVVAVNLYNFAKTVATPGTTIAQAVEQIDIGGPSLLRAAAKNWGRVAVLCDPNDYREVTEAMIMGRVPGRLRYRLAGKVFEHTANYDAAIAAYWKNNPPLEVA